MSWSRMARKSGFTLLALSAHIVLFWAFVQRVAVQHQDPVLVPAVVLASLVVDAVQKPEPLAPAPKPPTPVRKPAAQSPAAPAARPAPAPAARAIPLGDVKAQEGPVKLQEPTSAVHAIAVPVNATSQASEAVAIAIEKPAPPVASAAKARPASVTQPSSDASYLRNPTPPYPRLSKQQGEFGVVVLTVLVSAGGEAQEVHIATSSSYDRLDQSAQETVRRWRFMPGFRDGVPTAMWFRIPVNFVLE
jgi:periplasmic protein TonB